MNALLPQTYLLGLIGLLAIVAVVGGRQFLRVRRDEQSLLKMEQEKVASSKDAGALYELASVQLRKRLYPQAIVTLRQAVKRYKTRDFWEISRGKYLKAETKNYLPKLLAVILIAKQPEKYGFTDIADEFRGTKAGNLANYYAGISYLKLKKYEEAIEYLSNFNSDDELILLLDESVQFESNVINRFVSTYEKNKGNFGAIFPRILNGNDTILASGINIQVVTKEGKPNVRCDLKGMNSYYGYTPGCHLSTFGNKNTLVKRIMTLDNFQQYL